MTPISRSSWPEPRSSDPPGAPDPHKPPERARAGGPPRVAPFGLAFPGQPESLPYAFDERARVVDAGHLAVRQRRDAFATAQRAVSLHRGLLQAGSLGCLANALAGAANVAMLARLLRADDFPAPVFMAFMSLSALVSAADAILLHRAARPEAEPAHRSGPPGRDAGVSARATFRLLTGIEVSQITSVRLARTADFVPAALAGSCSVAMWQLAGDASTGPELRAVRSAAVVAASTAVAESALRAVLAGVRVRCEQASAVLEREDATGARSFAPEDLGPPGLGSPPGPGAVAATVSSLESVGREPDAQSDPSAVDFLRRGEND